MNDIQIFEQDIIEKEDEIGKIAIFRGGFKTNNPTAELNEAVLEYVGNKGHNEFVEIHLDNPWVRIVIHTDRDLDYKVFENQRL